MASGTKLVFTFKDNNDKNVQYTYNYANSSATTQQVVAHAESMITNTAVLAKTLVSITSIKQVMTEESEYDISNATRMLTRTPTETINGNPERETTENEVTEVKEVKFPY